MATRKRAAAEVAEPPRPDRCASCRAELEQPVTGRPRTYCGIACRRLAERKILLAERLLSRAAVKEQDCRAADARFGYGADSKEVKFWQAEVARCEAELAALLGLGAVQAAAVNEGSGDR